MAELTEMSETRRNSSDSKDSAHSKDAVALKTDSGKETDALIAREKPASDIKVHFVGYACVAFGMIEKSIGQMFAQLLNRLVPHSELNALRYVVQFAIAVVMVGASEKKQVRVEREKIGWLILASMSAVTINYTSYGAAYYLPIGVSCALSRSLEMLIYFLITVVMSRTFKVDQAVALSLCAVGVLLVVQPPLIFSRMGDSLLNSSTALHSPCNVLPKNLTVDVTDKGNSSTNTNNNKALNHGIIIGYSLVALEVPASVTCLLVIRYKLTNVDTMIYIFWNAVNGVLISLVLMLASEVPTLPYLMVCAMFLIGHMLVSGSHTFFVSFGYKLSHPVIAGLLKTIQIPSNFILQYTILSGMYPGHANVLEIVGATIVFTGNALVPFIEAVQYKRSKHGDTD